MDSITKQTIINSSKGEFMRFLENDFNGKILELLDTEGLNLLKDYPYINDRINYILVYSKFINKLLLNQEFLDLFLNTNIYSYTNSLGNLDPTSYNLILTRAKELGKSNQFIAKLISYFNVDYQKALIGKWLYPNNLLYDILNASPYMLGPIILKKFPIDLSNHQIKLLALLEAGKRLALNEMRNHNIGYSPFLHQDTIYFSKEALNAKVAKRLYQELDIYELRRTLNDFEYCGDPSTLNNYVKLKEENIILNENLPQILQTLLMNFQNEVQKSKRYDETDKFKEAMITKLKSLGFDSHSIIAFLKNNSLIADDKQIEDFINKLTSDYVIDYHLEENYYNIIYDLRELLNFYYAGNISIPEERLYLYQRLSDLDKLSVKEKIELHLKLKKINIKEAFYDDMTRAKKIIRDELKYSAFSLNDLNKYKDDKLSNKYGVPIYNIEDNHFFALVKSGRKTQALTPGGASFSLIGNGNLTTYHKPEFGSTFVYDSDKLTSEQIVHIYPKDSFTFYNPLANSLPATKNIEQLIMPDELLAINQGYNEILIFEQGQVATDLDSKIPRLNPIALYCLDKITSRDIDIAKEKNIGIMLVNSKKHSKAEILPPNVYRHYHQDIDYNELEYLNSSFDFNKHSQKR